MIYAVSVTVRFTGDSVTAREVLTGAGITRPMLKHCDSYDRENIERVFPEDDYTDTWSPR